jgi:hypothetical protein
MSALINNQYTTVEGFDKKGKKCKFLYASGDVLKIIIEC